MVKTTSCKKEEIMLADLHIHSKYARATSKTCEPEHLDLWARRKGISLIGTGDMTHPAWQKELRQKLIPTGNGLYTLKKEYLLHESAPVNHMQTHFVLSGEISCIYKRDGKTRKVHNLILLPSLEYAEDLSRRLAAIGNIHSDGRPILGLDSRDLLEIALETCEDVIFVPAHIWTPHFSLFGAYSGFNTIEECFADLTPHIHSLETGLSSDPAMNRTVRALDGYHLISNSDAHSPQKLGREATILDCPLSYDGLAKALKEGKNGGLVGTIEFFPEEGKYHFDGHRNCKQVFSPEQTARLNGICPVCGKKLTIGVSNRIYQLADQNSESLCHDVYENLIPLPEVLSACGGYSAASQRGMMEYQSLLSSLGAEFFILREASLSDIAIAGGEALSEGIRRMRDGEVIRIPGYDGLYGKIELYTQEELSNLKGQLRLFSPVTKKAAHAAKPSILNQTDTPTQNSPQKSDAFNAQQLCAIEADEPVVAVIAGPGTGKTKTLIGRIVYLIQQKGIKPSQITAVTFTQKAAVEMKQRLQKKLSKKIADKVNISTFHQLCLKKLLKTQPNLKVLTKTQALQLAKESLLATDCSLTPQAFVRQISLIKNQLQQPIDDAFKQAFLRYQERLDQANVCDFDDLIQKTCETFEKQLEDGKKIEPSFSHLLVDEFQDVNPTTYALLKILQQGACSLFVIGDQNQAIYGFRGSDPLCFKKLKDDFNPRIIRLLTCYRCTPEILKAASSILSENEMLSSHKSSTEKIRLIQTASQKQEGIFIAKQINRLVGGLDMLDAHRCAQNSAKTNRDFSDFAILYRTHRQAALLEKCLAEEDVPAIVFGRESFLDEPLIAGTLAFFSFLENPLLSDALFESLSCLFDFERSLFSLSSDEKKLAQRFSLTLQSTEPIPTDFQKEPFLPLLNFGRKTIPFLKKEKPFHLLSDWFDFLKIEKNQTVHKLLCLCCMHKNIRDLLASLLYGDDADCVRTGTMNGNANAVKLMTMHGAKGLEFPIVFLAGFSKGIIPFDAFNSASDLKEEERLLYVGMTRAKEQLYLLQQEPSSLTDKLPRETLAFEKVKLQSVKQLSLFDKA